MLLLLIACFPATRMAAANDLLPPGWWTIRERALGAFNNPPFSVNTTWVCASGIYLALLIRNESGHSRRAETQLSEIGRVTGSDGALTDGV